MVELALSVFTPPAPSFAYSKSATGSQFSVSELPEAAYLLQPPFNPSSIFHAPLAPAISPFLASAFPFLLAFSYLLLVVPAAIASSTFATPRIISSLPVESFQHALPALFLF